MVYKGENHTYYIYPKEHQLRTQVKAVTSVQRRRSNLPELGGEL